MIKALNYFLYILFSLILIFLFFLNFFDYNQNINFISIISNTDNKNEKLRELFTINKLNNLNYVLLIYLFIIIVTLIYKIIFFFYIENNYHKLLINTQTFFKLHKKYYLIYILIILPSTFLKFFFIFYMPGTYDEIFTIINFTSKGFFTSIAYYPAPNNHVFFSIIASFFNYLPFDNLLINRFLNIIISIFFLLILFISIFRIFNLRTAIVLCFFTSSLYPVLSYGYLSRGYGLIILLSYISFYLTYNIYSSSNDKKNIYLLVISLMSFFGIATNPSYLYFFLIINFSLFIMFIIKNEYKNIFVLFLHSLIISIFLLIFYSPILFISGFDSIFGNRFVDSIETIKFIEFIYFYFRTIPNYLFINYIIFYICIVTFLFLSLLKIIHPKHYLLFSITFILPLIFILIHDIIPPERIFVFLIPSFIFLVALIFSKIKFTFLNNILSSFFILLSLFSFSDSFLRAEQHHSIGKVGKIASKYILNTNVKNIYLKHGLLDAFLIYYGNNKLNIDYSYEYYESIQNKKNYDLIILDYKKTSQQLEHKKTFIMDINKTNYNIFVYKNNNYEK